MKENINEQQSIQIAELKKEMELRFGFMEKEIDDIKNNHLNCLRKKIDAQRTWLIGGLTTILVGLILNLLK